MNSRVSYSAVSGKVEIAGSGRGGRRWGLAWKICCCAGACAILCAVVACIVYFSRPPCRSQSPLLNDTASGKTNCSNAENQTNVLEEFRLPTDVVPTHYDIILAPYFYSGNYSDFQFAGSVQIRALAVNSTQVIRLHREATITIGNFSIYNHTYNWTIKSLEYEEAKGWDVITLNEHLPAGMNFTIEVDHFQSKLTNFLVGLYYFNYSDGGVIKHMVATQMEPTYARKALPCFDEPAFKATFSVGLVRRSDYLAAANTPSIRNQSVSISTYLNVTDASDWILETFAISPKMPIYLLAVQVSQLGLMVGRDNHGRLYRVWAREQWLENGRYALRTGAEIMRFFENYTKTAYFMEKTDQTAVPQFGSGAMENWGLINYLESMFLYNSTFDSALSKQLVALTVSHELAHQWFGNLVTPEWWSNLWLSEGFCSFLENIGVHEQHPDWDADAQFVATAQLDAMEIDSKSTSRPADGEPGGNFQIMEKFDAITYSKVAAILRQLHNSIGADSFREALVGYLRKFAFSNTSPSDLYRVFNEHSPRQDVGDLMSRWISQMGYPVLITSPAADHRLLHIRQRHFLTNCSHVPPIHSPYNYKWVIPVTMATAANISSWNGSSLAPLVQWMRNTTQTFEMDSADWYLLNLRSSGFYRVKYDENNWRQLIRQLRSNHSVFSPQDRARLIDDSWSLAREGELSYALAMDLLRYLPREGHNAPWKVAVQKLSFVTRMLQKESVYGKFVSYANSLIGPAFQLYMTREINDSSHIVKLLQDELATAGCEFGLPDCEELANKQYRQFISSNFTKFPPPDGRFAVLCTGIAQGSSEEWESLFHLLQQQPPLGVANDIMKALACSKEPWILRRYFELTLEERQIRRQDWPLVINGVAKNAIGEQMLWHYLGYTCANSDAFSDWRTIAWTLATSMDFFNTVEAKDRLQAFKETNQEKLEWLTATIDDVIASTESNLIWMQQRLPELQKLLN